MSHRPIHEQLQLAFHASGLSEWELARHANVKSTLTAMALRGDGSVPMAAWRRLACALNLELALIPRDPERRLVGTVPTVIDQVYMSLSPERVVLETKADTVSAGVWDHVKPQPRVLALDLEATLISNVASQFPRPGLFEFLVRCRELFPRVVIFTSVREDLFRQIASVLVDEGSAPKWFQQLEYVHWTGSTKNLTFISDCMVSEVILVDDFAAYIHPGQQEQWIQIEPFEPPFVDTGAGLEKVLKELETRLSTGSVKRPLP